jgi:hypothetical protein
MGSCERDLEEERALTSKAPTVVVGDKEAM